MAKKLLLLFLFATFSTLAQKSVPKNLLSKVIGENIKTYRINSQDAYLNNDFERAEFLFDSLINNVVNGSYIDNFKVRKFPSRKIEFYDFKKPVFLMTYASWCTPGSGEIPALNEIAAKHHKDIDFVVLYWDTKSQVKKATKDYNKHITIIYVDELENKHNHMVETLKHSLGFPTSFFINQDKMIVDVRRGVLHPYNEDYSISFELNYNSFYNGISLLKNLQEDPMELSSSKNN